MAAWGVMFSKRMVESGAGLPAQFVARPMYAADFVAVVKDAALADATTPLEVLQHIAEVVPCHRIAGLNARRHSDRSRAHRH